MRWLAAAAICLAVSTPAHADDWQPHRDPFDPVVVGRYKAILAKAPHDEAALRHLVALYQQSRTVAKLEAEYRAQGEDWSTLVVLARLPRTSRDESIALWKRALAANADDALGWLALGDATTTDAASARDAYRRAAQLVSAPRDKRAALTKLVRAAKLADDAATVDAAYVELIALAPKDGTLWLERGESQLGAKRFAQAKDSFATAETMLHTDPERRLVAMMNEAIALDGLDRSDDAIAQCERVLDAVPSGHYLGSDAVARIVDIERRRHRLTAAIARLEKRWPEPARGYFEWVTLGDLHKELGDPVRAIAAYQRAVAKAPTEVGTQRKLIALLDKERPADALGQLETAARLAPGDADLQFELAKRYHETQPAKAFATLEALARRSSMNVSVHGAIAELYEQWHEPARAIGEYAAIAAIEPKDPDHALVLGDAYWRAKNEVKAREAWQRLEKIGTSDALRRLGDVLELHELWPEAERAYTRSLAIDAANADALYGRARVYDALKEIPKSVEDARRAVALTSRASLADGLRNRQLLVKVLGRAYGEGDQASLTGALARWRFAFEHGDVSAGYLLAAHHARIVSRQQHEILVELYRRVPDDDSLGFALASSFTRRRDFDRARETLEQVARHTPARTKEVNVLIADLERDRERAERDIRMEEEGAPAGPTGPDLVGRDHRYGMRVELGTDVHRGPGALRGVGLYRMYRLAEGTAVAARLDWTTWNGEMSEVSAIAAAGMVATRIVDARKLELAIGAGPRFELRYGKNVGVERDRVGVGADLALELVPRAVPATLGLRFDRELTDPVKSSALILELGFEVR